MRAAAALHAQERGEAEDEEEKRTNRHGCGEVPIGASLSQNGYDVLYHDSLLRCYTSNQYSLLRCYTIIVAR